MIKGYIISLTESLKYIHYIAWQMFFRQLERGQLFKNLDRVELIAKRLVQKLFSRYPSPLLVDFLHSNFFSNSLGFLSEWQKMFWLVHNYAIQCLQWCVHIPLESSGAQYLLYLLVYFWSEAGYSHGV